MPILWTIKNTDIIFNSNIENQLGLDYKKFNEELLNSTSDSRGKITKLRGNIRKRLKSKNRLDLIIK